MPNGSLMGGCLPCLLLARLIAGLVVALPILTGGQAPAGAPAHGPARPDSSKTGLQANPDHRIAWPAAALRCPCHQKPAPQKRKVTRVVRGSFRHPPGVPQARSRKRTARDAAAYGSGAAWFSPRTRP